MKVSVISKEVHAKPLYAWLVENGYDVAMLGDNPTAIPSSTEILVCRHRSCSTQASSLANSWAKKTGRPMIMENGLKTISTALQKLNGVPNLKVVEPVDEFVLDTEKLDKLLENAAGKTMSWLAGRFGVRVDHLIPALLDAKRLAEVSATLAMPVTQSPEEEPEIPSTPSLGEMEEYASIILDERAEDPFEIQLSVLTHLAGGGHDEEVLRSLLSKQQAANEDPEPEVEAAPQPLEIEPLPPEESPMGGFIEESQPAISFSHPKRRQSLDEPLRTLEDPSSTLMEAFEALRKEVVALRAELKELKTPRGAVTLDDLIAAGATISIEPRK